MGWESFDVIRFDFGPLLQGQTRIAKPESAYNSLIISPRGLQCETNLKDNCRGMYLPPSITGEEISFFIFR